MKPILTKDQLIAALRAIRDRGWIRCTSKRKTNDGRIGNTLEDILGIEENNLPLPNAAEWELKTHRLGSSSLLTILHLEPSPRTLGLVADLLLPKYGWPHREAGEKYEAGELSFRQTIHAAARSDRGFKVVVDREKSKVLVSFDPSSVSSSHAGWLKSVESRVGLGELDPQPFWGFADLHYALGTKVHNCFYIEVEVRRERRAEYFLYRDMKILEKFDFDKFLVGMERGQALIDFDARTGHNHGTKFRIRSNYFPSLFQGSTVI